jgi:hypothetical protein
LDRLAKLRFQATKRCLQQSDEPLLQVELRIGGARGAQAVTQEGESFTIDPKRMCLLLSVCISRLVRKCGVGHISLSCQAVMFTRMNAW